MARARNIKPGFFSNDALAECEPLARILFAGLWCIADKSGRLEDRPKKIKAEVLPYDDCDADDLLSQLEKHGFILRYSVCNFNAIQILNFEKHQNPHVKEAESTIQAPDKNSASPLQEQETHTTNPADSLLPITDSLISDTGLPSKDLSAPSAQTTKKGTSLPADWKLSKEWGDWALSEKPDWTADDVRRVADDFKDHWLANANQAKSKKADWFATWRKWVRSPLNEIKLAKPANKHTALVDSNRAAINEWLKQDERVVS